jgi:hypothetical protein
MGIFVPGLGGMIPAVIIMHRTDEKNCEENRAVFVHSVNVSEKLQQK